jgi:hypothetical protein
MDGEFVNCHFSLPNPSQIRLLRIMQMSIDCQLSIQGDILNRWRGPIVNRSESCLDFVGGDIGQTVDQVFFSYVSKVTKLFFNAIQELRGQGADHPIPIPKDAFHHVLDDGGPEVKIGGAIVKCLLLLILPIFFGGRIPQGPNVCFKDLPQHAPVVIAGILVLLKIIGVLNLKGFIFNFFANLSSQKDEGKVGGGFEDVGEGWDGDVRVK